MHFLRVLAVLLLAKNMVAMHAARFPVSDSCDWTGSGTFHSNQVKGVQPVYLRCVQGTVKWNYPHGALRVVLRKGVSGNEFRACLRMTKGSSGARVYLTGKKKLHLLFTPDDPSDLVKCVTSRDGQVALYVEADPLISRLIKAVSGFVYHLKHFPRRSFPHRDTEECQPCSEKELLEQYCSSDFVVQGTVSGLYHNQILERSEVTVRATKVFRDSEPQIFRETSSHAEESSPKYAVLHRPINCGTKAGNGEFVFMGTWVLGNPTLTCVPRLIEWKRIKRKAVKHGFNPCNLD